MERDVVKKENARLDQLERLMGRMAELAKRLDEGSLKEFVNSRSEEARSVMDEIRKAVAEGRLDDAREPEARPREVLQDVGVVVEVGARAAPLRENRGRRRRRRRGLEHARVARPRHDAAARDGADAHAEEAALRPARHDERPCGS